MRSAAHTGLLAVLLLAGAAAGGRAAIEVYPPTPLAKFDDELELSLDGEKVRLETQRVEAEEKRERRETSRVRFAASRSVRAKLEVKGRTVQRAILKAVGKDLKVRVSKSSLSFTLPGPGHYYMKVWDDTGFEQTILYWVDEPEKDSFKPEGDGVIDVTKEGVKSDPSKLQTREIQALLDRCSRQEGGGTLHFPAGVYRSGSLRIGSNTTLRVDKGALLKGSDDKDDFSGPFLHVKGARRVRLGGRGTIDANGMKASGKKIHNIDVEDSSEVEFEDLLFRDSNSWAMHLIKSEKITVRNVKIFSGKDGFDPDSSRDVTIENVFVQSMDDAIAVKARFKGRPCEKIVFRDAMVSSVKSCLKIGTETRADIRDVTFENCEVFDGGRGIVIYAHDGGTVERATWRNIRMNLADIPSESRSGIPLHLLIEKKEGLSRIRDCRIENVETNFIYCAHLAGHPDSPLTGIEMKNIAATVFPPKKDKPHLFVCFRVKDVPVRGLKIDWQGNEERWAGVVGGEGLIIR